MITGAPKVSSVDSTPCGKCVENRLTAHGEGHDGSPLWNLGGDRVTVKEASNRLGMKPKAVYRHIERGTPLGKIFKKKGWRRVCLAKELRRFCK